MVQNCVQRSVAWPNSCGVSLSILRFVYFCICQVWRSASSCSNNPNWPKNPQFQLELAKAMTVVISLGHRNTKKKPHIGFLVFKDAGKPMTAAFSPLHTASFIDAMVSGEIELAAGRYVVVPSTFDPGVEVEFAVRLLEHSKNSKSL